MIQSVLFPLSSFTSSEANKWLIEHKYKKMKPLHKTKNYLRARISNVEENKKYYSFSLNNGIVIVSYE